MAQAGASAQREYEKRRTAERAAIRSNLVWTVPLVIVLSTVCGIFIEKFVGSMGILASLVTAVALGVELWGTSASTAAYGKGAEGERLTGRPLDELEGYVVLHDRKIPGSKANIDHVAIGPAGVFVVETKNYTGEVTSRRDDLLVGGRRRTSIVEQTWREAVAVQGVLATLLAEFATDVVPVLCIHGSRVPRMTVQGVTVVGPRGLKRLITKAPRVFSDTTVRAMTDLAEGALKPS
jgi:hypothetical protein